MKLYLARHGNTFREQDMPVFIGREQDLPLVEEGKRQAERLGHFILTSQITFRFAYAATLLRTQEFAKIVLQTAQQACPIEVDSRLDEISYGAWGGKSAQEIEQMGHGKALQAWRSEGTWPSAVFPETEQCVAARVEQILKECIKLPEDESVLIVSSNGILRFFLYAVPGLYEREQREGKLVMKTGALSLLECKQGAWQLSFWNKIIFE